MKRSNKMKVICNKTAFHYNDVWVDFTGTHIKEVRNLSVYIINKLGFKTNEKSEDISYKKYRKMKER